MKHVRTKSGSSAKHAGRQILSANADARGQERASAQTPTTLLADLLE